MKKFFIIAAVAAAGIALTGCESKDSQQEYQIRLPKSVEETTGAETLLTEYEWTEDYAPAGMTFTVTGSNRPSFEDSDYSYSGYTATFIRTFRTDGTVSDKQKRVVEYTSGWGRVKSIRVYQLDLEGNEVSTAPIERQEEFYSGNQVSKYEHEVNGVVVLRYDGYVYTSNTMIYNIWDLSTDPATQTTSTSVYTYDVLDYEVITDKSGQQLEIKRYQYSPGPVYAGYKKYRKENGNDVLMEEQTDYSMSSDNKTESYKTIWYDADGTTVSSQTTTTKKYDIKTITVTF